MCILGNPRPPSPYSSFCVPPIVPYPCVLPSFASPPPRTRALFSTTLELPLCLDGEVAFPAVRELDANIHFKVVLRFFVPLRFRSSSTTAVRPRCDSTESQCKQKHKLLGESSPVSYPTPRRHEPAERTDAACQDSAGDWVSINHIEIRSTNNSKGGSVALRV